MIERPILFSDPMVRAILDGRKTVTRRPLTPQPVPGRFGDGRLIDRIRGMIGPTYCVWEHPKGTIPMTESCAYRFEPLCPLGEPGDRLWVRECWGTGGHFPYPWAYRADGKDYRPERWRPSIHMPRAACRLLLDVVSVRAERLLDITDDDALAEGVEPMPAHLCEVPNYRREFSRLWDGLYGTRPGLAWDANPWVWRVEFRRVGEAAAAAGGAA